MFLRNLYFQYLLELSLGSDLLRAVDRIHKA